MRAYQVPGNRIALRNHVRLGVRLCWTLGIVLAACCGCSSEELVPLTGTVTFRGKPLDTGNITFIPDADGPRAYAQVQPDATYFAKTGTRKGIRPGNYAVLFTAFESIPQPTDLREKESVLLTPQRYRRPETSPLRCVVPTEGGRFDIVLDDEPS
jgi:hypothetical protein